MSFVSGFETITAVVDSDQISSSLHATAPLTQYLKIGTEDIAPDWSVPNNQPTIYVRAKSQLEGKRKTIQTGTEKWFYLDKEITFSSTGESTNPAKKFKKVTYDDGGVMVPGLRITGNFVSSTDAGSAKISFEGIVDLQGISTKISPDIEIRLEETTGDSYEGYIDATEGGIIDEDTDEITCTAILYRGGSKVNTNDLNYQWFKQNDGKWDLISSASGNQATFKDEDINSELVIRCDFYHNNTKAFSAFRQLSDETDPLIISSNPSGPTQLKSGENVKFTPKVIRRSNGDAVSGYNFNYAAFNSEDQAISDFAGKTGASITINHEDVKKAKSIKLYITAKK